MREYLFRGQEKNFPKNVWVEGNIIVAKDYTAKDFIGILEKENPKPGRWEYPYLNGVLGDIDGQAITVIPETVGQYTGLTDKNDKKIFDGDIVDFFGSRGVVTFECGAFGVGFKSGIDYDTMQQRIYDLTGTRNTLHCCFNDNFISLWEIFWNFNCEGDCCHVLEVIGNIHDNPELLEEGKR